MTMRKFLLAFLLAVLSLPVSARILPASARFGEVKSVTSNQITIADTVFRTAPGLRVINQNNVQIFVRQLPVDTLVGYQVDGRGELFQVWMLTEQEISARGLEKRSIFSFGN